MVSLGYTSLHSCVFIENYNNNAKKGAAKQLPYMIEN